ncbi:MAG: [Fe-Fe] hydrogenase large subunit C-terminal domain-containing protein [Armatimonadota bacterium]
MSLITINQVNCKDCYKCVRYCPVKAIRIVNGHAEVVEELCLGDGNCLHICPQRAKQARSDVEVVRGLLASGRPVMASIAPSAVGVYGEQLPRLLGALKALGFSRIEETARTAEPVARASAEMAAVSTVPLISTACPAVVSLVKSYFPQYAPQLIPVQSPMVAHAHLLREEHGEEIAVVFIGPCIAKKGEAGAGDIDAALTFDELSDWLAEEAITLADGAPATFDNAPVGIAQLFPLPNGMLRTANLPCDLLATEVITVSGLPEVIALLKEFPTLQHVRLIEALACPGGCLVGPGAAQGPAAWQRRARLLCSTHAEGKGASPADLTATYTAAPLHLLEPTDEEIAAILRRTGKHAPEDEQNCAACGYDTCREKAVAVFRGMAEAEMCIPYMRTRAESFANVVLRSTPNGIIVVDGALRVLDANPAFEKMFGQTLSDMIGRPVKVILNTSGFERVQRTGRPFVRQELAHGEIIIRELIFPVADEEMIIGLYIDVTEEVGRRKKLQQAKQETLGKARQVIDKQMRVAQEIAGLLGETTAETKVLLTRLIHLYDEED